MSAATTVSNYLSKVEMLINAKPITANNKDLVYRALDQDAIEKINSLVGDTLNIDDFQRSAALRTFLSVRPISVDVYRQATLIAASRHSTVGVDIIRTHAQTFVWPGRR